MMSDSENTLHCNFCGKPKDELKKLIAGPKVFICNECVEICMDICGFRTTTGSEVAEKSRAELACTTTELAQLQTDLQAAQQTAEELSAKAQSAEKVLGRIIQEAELSVKRMEDNGPIVVSIGSHNPRPAT